MVERVEFPDTVYRLRVKDLVPGDIIGSTSPSSLLSRLIRFYTQGPISHVALLFEWNRLIEAIGRGVSVSSPYFFFVEDLSNVRVMRPRASIVDFFIDSEKRKTLHDTAMRSWLAGYSTEKILSFVVPPIRLLAQTDEYICSELVARVYLSCGIELCPGFPPEKVHPSQICASEKLVDITESVFERCSKTELESVYGSSLRTERESPKTASPRAQQAIETALKELKDHRERMLRISMIPRTPDDARNLAIHLDVCIAELQPRVMRDLHRLSSLSESYLESFSTEQKRVIREYVAEQVKIAMEFRRELIPWLRFYENLDDQLRVMVLPSYSKVVELHGLQIDILGDLLGFIDNIVSMVQNEHMHGSNLPPNSMHLEAAPMDVGNAQERIRNWLLDEGFKIQEIRDPICVFNFLVMDHAERFFQVSQYRTRKDQVGILASVGLAAEGKAKFDALEESKQIEFFWKLRFALLNIGVGAYGLLPPLGKITLETSIYYDGLTKDHFFERVALVQRASLLVTWMCMYEIGGGPHVGMALGPIEQFP